MMKKMAAIIFSVILCLSLTACGGGSSSSKCTICKKPATHSFQGSGYCDKHYQNAVTWAINNVAGK